jgi:hypothetical protein
MMRPWVVSLCALVLQAANSTPLFAADFTLTIYRQYADDHCTSGYLAVDGTIQAYALERPWKGNEPSLSAIPAGTYTGILRYDHSDQWRIQLVGVPKRSNIQIHTGNVPDDTEGCILIGKQMNPDLCSIKGGTSAPAYADLKKPFMARLRRLLLQTRR